MVHKGISFQGFKLFRLNLGCELCGALRFSGGVEGA